MTHFKIKTDIDNFKTKNIDFKTNLFEQGFEP